VLIISITLVVTILAFTLIAANMSKHQTLLVNNNISVKQANLLQVLGYILLLFAFYLCTKCWQTTIATCVWLSLSGFAAIILGLLFTYPNKFIMWILCKWVNLWLLLFAKFTNK